MIVDQEESLAVVCDLPLCRTASLQTEEIHYCHEVVVPRDDAIVLVERNWLQVVWVECDARVAKVEVVARALCHHMDEKAIGAKLATNPTDLLLKARRVPHCAKRN